MKTESIKQKEILILAAISELADIFPMRLTDASKIAWVEELIKYSEERIIKAKTLLRASHRGYLYPDHFHEAISSFRKEKEKKEEINIKPVPMPDSFRKKYLNVKKQWGR